MSVSAEMAPLCPLTGKPAVRLVQWVAPRLLIDLWRYVAKVDARGSFAGVRRFGLWESPTGLYFFDPPREGDREFYSGLAARLRSSRLFDAKTVREEFLIAARRIPAGARVLDVGCGQGNFRQCVPEAEYTGIDPHSTADVPIDGVRNETLGEHLVGRAGSYDAVCCFEVIEHVRDPKALFAEIVQAAKPGGLICVSVPRVRSPMTRIPNFLINAPPHHLTWWSETALCMLAESVGAVVESIEIPPWGAGSAEIYWIERLSPIKCRDLHFRGAFNWHAASLISSLLGIAASKLFGAPRKAAGDGIGLLMIARRPAAPEAGA
jgi:2-polyprenyl-3-methyl-5-hydroxy-6-metoxy-1,4-benzoquinol methylase